MELDIGIISSWVGNKLSWVSTWVIQKISELINQEPSAFMGKLITIAILLLVILVFSKITNKLAKFGLIIVGILLIVSVVSTFFI